MPVCPSARLSVYPSARLPVHLNVFFVVVLGGEKFIENSTCLKWSGEYPESVQRNIQIEVFRGRDLSRKIVREIWCILAL